jgi:hypothetical protein
MMMNDDDHAGPALAAADDSKDIDDEEQDDDDLELTMTSTTSKKMDVLETSEWEHERVLGSSPSFCNCLRRRNKKTPVLLVTVVLIVIAIVVAVLAAVMASGSTTNASSMSSSSTVQNENSGSSSSSSETTNLDKTDIAVEDPSDGPTPTPAPTPTPTQAPTSTPTRMPTPPPTTSSTTNVEDQPPVAPDNGCIDDESSTSSNLESFDCLTDRIGHFKWIERGQALCNDNQFFGLTLSGELIKATTSCGNTTERVVLHDDLLAEAFQMTDHGHFMLVKDLVTIKEKNSTTPSKILWEAEPTIKINPTGICLSQLQIECPYLHLRKSGDLVLNSINEDGSWSDRKVSVIFPDLFP